MSVKHVRPLSVSVLFAVCAACAPESGIVTGDATPVRTVVQAAVYGNDDRRDYYEVTDERLRALTDGAIVAMMDPNELDSGNGGSITVDGQAFGPSYGLCSDERFYDQINAADCSATLIDDDLVLTAGHCVTSNTECQRKRWVFRYYMESETELASLTEEDVFGCSQLLVQEVSSTRNSELDYAIFQLDRPATPRFTPAPVAVDPQIEEGTPVVIIGFGSGLPAKIDDGGAVVDARSSTRDYFEATTDSFGGNSGSGVFNDQGEVIGILVRGQNDYDWSGRCLRPAEYSDSGTQGGAEGITYAERAIEDLCGTGWVSPRLCGNSAVCGDGVCSPGEESGCAEDCATGIPGWDCDPSFYGTGDGCDCACGATRDPDCADPTQEILNCSFGEVCDANGQCAPDDGTVTPDPDPVVPDGWLCDVATYGAGDGCDCECGVLDPDCRSAGAEIYNCDFGEICSTEGICITLDDGTTPEGSGGVDDTGFGGLIIDDASVPSGCAASPSSRPGLALLGLAALLVRRRRYGSSARTAS